MSSLAVAPAETSTSGYPPLEKGPTYWRSGDHAISIGVKDEDLARLYFTFREQGILYYLSYEKMPSLSQFMALFLRPENNTLGSFFENPKTGKWELCGIGFLRDVYKFGTFTRVDVGQAFCRGFASPGFLLKFGHLFLEYAFNGLNVDTVMGITPTKNRAAVIYAKKAGMTVVGPVPGVISWHGTLESGMFSAMTKDQWAKIRPWGKCRMPDNKGVI